MVYETHTYICTECCDSEDLNPCVCMESDAKPEGCPRIDLHAGELVEPKWRVCDGIIIVKALTKDDLNDPED